MSQRLGRNQHEAPGTYQPSPRVDHCAAGRDRNHNLADNAQS
jgi:hypothetical protein